MSGALLGVPEAALILGVSDQWVRRQAAEGLFGAQRVQGRWLLDADAVNAEAQRRRARLERRLPGRGASATAVAAVGRSSSAVAGSEDAVGEWERDAWALERQLLLSQAAAAEREAQTVRLDATISQRDATIAMLQAELRRTRLERDRWQQAARQLLGTFAHETADNPDDSSSDRLPGGSAEHWPGPQ